MSLNSVQDESQSPKNQDESESARKKIRLDNLARKSWSLTDKRTDEEILIEMGVSLLEPDDGEQALNLDNDKPLLKSGMKRKYDIENVNPNVNSAPSSVKSSPKRSPKMKSSPVAGPSFVGSPSSLDGAQLQDLETNIIHPFINDEETPEVQFQVKERNRPLSAKREHYTSYTSEDEPVTDSPIPELAGPNSFHTLSDEVLLQIFKWLPKRTLAHCMLVCKRWHRVASDEMFWQRLEFGNKTLAKGGLGKMLARKPVIVRLAGTEIGEWHPSTPIEQSRIQYLDLSMCCTDLGTLKALLDRCSGLKKLSLEGVPVNDGICEAIGKCNRMETLNLTMATGITAIGLKYILEGCPGLISLNIAWCNLCAESLTLLSTTAPSRLQRLNLAGARLLSDETVHALALRCPRLLELDASDCPRLRAPAAAAAAALPHLRHLALSRCYLMPPNALTQLSSMPSLQYLEVWGMLQAKSLAALRAALPGIQVNQFMHSAIARPTVGARRTSVWGLRTRD